MPSAEHYEEEYDERPGFWTKVKERMFGVDPPTDYQLTVASGA